MLHYNYILIDDRCAISIYIFKSLALVITSASLHKNKYWITITKRERKKEKKDTFTDSFFIKHFNESVKNKTPLFSLLYDTIHSYNCFQCKHTKICFKKLHASRKIITYH